MSHTLIEINNLTKKFNDKLILEDINLSFEEGNIYGIIGENGSGKSVFLKVLTGLTNTSLGEIKYYGKTLKKGEFPKSIGILLDSPGLLPQYSAMKNLSLISSIKKKINKIDIKEILSLVGIEQIDNTPIKKYSLGMKQKVGIAQALMENPKIIILDEPMNGLDENSITNIRNILIKLKSQDKLIILTSHNKDDIEILCDHVYKIKNKQIFKCNKQNLTL